MKDVWKPIPGFRRYLINSSGTVLDCLPTLATGRSLHSIDSNGRRQMTPYQYPNGYLVIDLVRDSDGKRVCQAIHKLVLNAFVGPRPNGMQARHLNGNPADNRIKNLKWGTARENASDREDHGHTARNENNGNSKLTLVQKKEILVKYRDKTCSQRKLAREYGVTQAAICSIIKKGRRYGFEGSKVHS